MNRNRAYESASVIVNGLYLHSSFFPPALDNVASFTQTFMHHKPMGGGGRRLTGN